MTQRDRNMEAVERNVRAFEEALAAGATSLPAVPISRALAVLDASNQCDLVGDLLADALESLPDVKEVGILGSPSETVERRLPARVRAKRLATRELLRQEDAHRSILETAREMHADLVVLPVPFLGDYADLAGESLSVTVDVLLERMHIPLLCARDPARTHVFGRVVLFVEDASAPALRAASVALALSRGPVAVVVAVPAAERAGWNHLAGRRFALDQEDVHEALSLGTATLVAALHRAAQQKGTEAHVRIAVEDLETVVAEKNEAPALHVVPQGPMARAVLLRSRNPVLAVA